MKIIVIGGKYYLTGVRPPKLNGRKVKVLEKEGVDYRCEVFNRQPGDKKHVLVTADNLLPAEETPDQQASAIKEKPSVKIIERLKKLMKMAERTEGNEAEAAVAAQMAENIMRKYNIDNADLIQDELRAGGRIVARLALEESDWTGERFPAWLKVLAPAIGDLFDCEVATVALRTRHPKTGERCVTVAFFGYEIDCELAVWTFETVVKEVNRLADKRWTNHKDEIKQKNEFERKEAEYDDREPVLTSAKAYKSSFRRAATNVVGRRIKDIIADRLKGITATGTALVVAKKKGVEDKFGDFKYSKRKFGYADLLGAMHGQEDGEKISLARPITTQTDERRLLR